MQQDAHEFLNHLLNTCGDILLGILKEKFLINHIFFFVNYFSGKKRRKR